MPKTLTSAVEGYTVAEVRKSLAEIRQAWGDNSVTTPFSWHALNFKDCSFHRFCFLFVRGHHQKRHRRVGAKQ